MPIKTTVNTKVHKILKDAGAAKGLTKDEIDAMTALGNDGVMNMVKKELLNKAMSGQIAKKKASRKVKVTVLLLALVSTGYLAAEVIALLNAGYVSHSAEALSGFVGEPIESASMLEGAASLVAIGEPIESASMLEGAASLRANGLPDGEPLR